MKKYIALLLALVLMTGLATGCAKEEPVDTLYDENMPNKLLLQRKLLRINFAVLMVPIYIKKRVIFI